MAGWCALTLNLGLLSAGPGSAQDEAQGGAPVETATPAEAWATVCQALAPGRTACSLVQRQVLENGGILLALELSGLEEGATPLLAVLTPLGTHLGEGVRLVVDGADLARLSFETCLQGGCVARLSGEEMVGRLRAGASLEVRFALEGAAEAITLSAPLRGLARAVDIVREER